jgi:hypothetical protein
MTHVVAGGVGASLSRLTSSAGNNPHEVAMQHAVETARDVQGEPSNNLFGWSVSDQTQGVR